MYIWNYNVRFKYTLLTAYISDWWQKFTSFSLNHIGGCPILLYYSTKGKFYFLRIQWTILLYYSTKGKFYFLRTQWKMTISIWKGKPCSCFIVKHFSFFYLLFGFIEHLWHEKSQKVLGNIPRISAEEGGRAIGMLQTDYNIRNVIFWKCSMLLQIIQFRCFDYEYSFNIDSLKNSVGCTVVAS
jgi:hypothetical protein